MLKYGSVGYKVILFLRVIWDMLKDKTERKLVLSILATIILLFMFFMEAGIFLCGVGIALSLVINNLPNYTDVMIGKFVVNMSAIGITWSFLIWVTYDLLALVVNKGQEIQEELGLE